MMLGFTALVMTCTAQDPPAKPEQGADRAATTVTGCVSQDSKDKDMFMITGEDGKAWSLKSTTVKLSSHVNHKVTVTGTAKEANAGQPGELTVANLKMVSQTCQ